MKLKESFIQALQKINEYSNNGSLISMTSGNQQDYLLRMPGFANDAQMKIAQFVKIPSVKTVSQPQIPNLLGDGWDIDLCLLEAPRIYVAAGAKSYHLEVDRPCTITIEENGSVLKTINVVGIAQFTQYKGNVNPVGNNTTITMRVTCTQPVQVKNRALFAYIFGTDLQVPDYKPFIPYTLDNYLEFNKITRAYDNRQLQEWSDFKKPTKEGILYLNWYLNGEFNFHYYRLPSVIDSTTSDDYVYEVDLKTHFLIPYYIGGRVADNANIRNTLLDEFDNMLANLSREPITPTSAQIQTVYGM